MQYRIALLASLLLVACSTKHVGPVPPGEGGEEDLAMLPEEDAGEPPGNPDLAQLPGKADLAGTPPGDMAMPVNPNTCNQALVIKPANQTLYVDGVHAFKITYQLLCGNFDVGPAATWTVDDGTLGGFNANTFVSAPAGKGTSTVRAKLGMQTATTAITLKLTTVVIGPNTPNNAPNLFGGGNDPNLAPQWVYPAEGVLIPPNLSELEFQFMPKGNALFELGFGGGGGVNLKIYTVCNSVGGGCTFQLDEPTWALLSTVARGQTVTVTVRGTSMNGGPVGTSAARKISFSDEDVTGGLYYWAASSGSVNRYDFGLRGQKGEVFLAGNQFNCAGCHALSRDGSRIAVGWGIPGMQMQVIDVASKQATYTQGGFIGASTFEAFSPDGAKVITSEGNKLTLRDLKGNVLATGPSGATMPDVSADGAHVTYAYSPKSPPLSSPGIGSAGINVVDLNNNAFGQPRAIVAPKNGEDYYYPSYSPDGAWIVYNRSVDKPDPMNNNQVTSSSYDQPDARVMFVSAGGGAAIDSTGLNQIAGNSWPKWAPFIHHFNGGTVFWLTFSTRRPYGLRGGSNAQLWMVAVDPAKLGQNADGAYPAFRLPFQDFSTGNHIAQWAQKVVRKPCSVVQGLSCVQGEVCVNGFCQPQP